MADFCPKCGNKLKEDENFCTKCGHKIIEDDEKDSKIEVNAILKINQRNYKIISLILAIVSLIVSILMALGMPMIVADNAILLCVSGIIGGIGILICIRKEEYLMASICSFATLIMCFVSAYIMSTIPCIFFLITAIFILVGGNLKINNKKFWIIPVVIIVIPFLILGLSAAGTGNGDDISISNIQNTIAYSYEYYDGEVYFELTTEKDYDYLQVALTYYDASGKVIHSDSLAWNQLDVKPGTYKVSANYFEKEMPQKATIDVFDKSSGEAIYTKNITF